MDSVAVLSAPTDGLPLAYTIGVICVVVAAFVAVAYHISRPGRPISEWQLPPGTHWSGGHTRRWRRWPFFGFWYAYSLPPVPSEKELKQQQQARAKVADMMQEVKTQHTK